MSSRHDLRKKLDILAAEWEDGGEDSASMGLSEEEAWALNLFAAMKYCQGTPPFEMPVAETEEEERALAIYKDMRRALKEA